MTNQVSTRVRGGRWPMLVPLVLALVWTYMPTIKDLVREWSSNPNYSVGMIVPFAALYLLWYDRDRLRHVPIRPAWSGLLVLLFAQLVRFFGMAALFESAERYSIPLTVAGLVILVGGWQLFWRLKYLLAFLFLMVPFPGSIHNMISSPLQDLSANGAVATLELLGIQVEQSGHVLTLNGQVPVAVAEACSGLRMLTAFIFVSAMFAYAIQRSAWQKLVVLLSSIPIAIVANLLRLVATGLLFLWTNDRIANRFFHDFAGWTMMPIAVGLLMGELWLMSRLVTEDRDESSKTSV